VRRRAFLASLVAVPLLARAERGTQDAGTLEPSLRRGGLVLLMRHASTEGAAGDTPGVRIGD